MNKIMSLKLSLVTFGFLGAAFFFQTFAESVNSKAKISSDAKTKPNDHLRPQKTSLQVLPHDAQISWVGKKVTGQHNGVLSLKEGQLNLESSVIKSGQFKIDMTTIKCLDLKDPELNQKLVTHLKSNDFFEVDKFPIAIFEITSVKELADKNSGNTHEVEGRLSLKGRTEVIKFPAKIQVDSKKITWSSELKIDRTRFDLKFRSAKFFENLGDKLIYDDFFVTVSFSAAI